MRSTIDVAFIQGGLDVPQPNIQHVDRILPETLHLLIRGNIHSLRHDWVADVKIMPFTYKTDPRWLRGRGESRMLVECEFRDYLQPTADVNIWSTAPI